MVIISGISYIRTVSVYFRDKHLKSFIENIILNNYISNTMAQGIHKVTEDFEMMVSDYTGAPYVIALDNMSNALFLSLYYEKNVKKNISSDFVLIPSRTYPSVPCEIIHAGLKVSFEQIEGTTIKGAYQLKGTNVWDSALRFTADMYIPNSMMCISFTGAYKHFKLSKGGAILLDDLDAYKWLKKARFSGRSECSYHDDNFDVNPVIGWNFYMTPELSARGLLLISQFYNTDGTKKHNEDLELPYPDLSKFKIYTNN
jgi:dTDP-4-amino-4,6-dideoxygalactose transaminase